MKRRAVLAAVGGVGAAGMAGCTSFGSETISTPSEHRADDGETTLTFEADAGDQVATLTIDPGERRYGSRPGQQLPVDIAITHSADTTITALRLALRAPPAGAGAPAEVALKTPFGTPHPSLELYAAPTDSATVLAIDDMGEQGDGTMVFRFLLTGLDDDIAELGVDAEIGVAASGLFGTEYTLEGLTLVPLPGGTE